MAQMRPDSLSSLVTDDPFRKAEITFFEAAKRLPDNWIVLYGVAWIDNTRRDRATEGEADFVIIGPDIGLVFVEIKGGGITRKNGEWFSIDRKGDFHPIKNPMEQAISCKHKIIEYLRLQPVFKNKYIPAVQLVCFPNISEKDLVNYIDCPVDLQISFDDLNDMKNKIKRTVNGQNIHLNENECFKIASILKPTNTMPGRLSIISKMQTEIMNKMTSEQINVIEAAQRNKLIGITGPAGSGKTLTAMKWAEIQAAGGNNVLVCVPNDNLREFYNAIFTNNNKIITSKFLDIEFYLAKMGSSINQIIVDEAQLLPIGTWDAIERYIKGKRENQLLVIYDSNQRILKRGSFYLPDNLTELYLKNVIRNTKEIAEVSKMFFSDDRDINIVGPSGPEIEKLIIQNDDEIFEVISKYIRKQVLNEGFDYSDIVVLYAWGAGRSLRIAENYYGISFRTTKTFGLSEKHPMVKCGNVIDYIGLESAIVILIGLDRLCEKELYEACYIGTSRARNILAVVAKEDTFTSVFKKNI